MKTKHMSTQKNPQNSKSSNMKSLSQLSNQKREQKIAEQKSVRQKTAHNNTSIQDSSNKKVQEETKKSTQVPPPPNPTYYGKPIKEISENNPEYNKSYYEQPMRTSDVVKATVSVNRGEPYEPPYIKEEKPPVRVNNTEKMKQVKRFADERKPLEPMEYYEKFVSNKNNNLNYIQSIKQNNTPYNYNNQEYIQQVRQNDIPNNYDNQDYIQPVRQNDIPHNYDNRNYIQPLKQNDISESKKKNLSKSNAEQYFQSQKLNSSARANTRADIESLLATIDNTKKQPKTKKTIKPVSKYNIDEVSVSDNNYPNNFQNNQDVYQSVINEIREDIGIPRETAEDIEQPNEQYVSIIPQREVKHKETLKKLPSAAFYERLFSDFSDDTDDIYDPEKEENEENTEYENPKKIYTSKKPEPIKQVSQPNQTIQNNPSKKIKTENINIPKKQSIKLKLNVNHKDMQKSERTGIAVRIIGIGAVMCGIAGFLLFGSRSTMSYEENRKLAEFPKFSIESLLDGSYTAGISNYYNDTIPKRSNFKHMISSMMQLKGKQKEEDTVFFGNVQQVDAKKDKPAEAQTTTTITTISDTSNQNKISSENALTTTSITTTDIADNEPAAEIGEGIILSKKRAICVYGGGFSTGEAYANTLNSFKQSLGQDVNVYSLVAPTSVSYYLPEEYMDYTASEEENIQHINEYLNDVKPIDAYNVLKQHTSEEIYARTDHHWLPLGAFYAAEEFAKVANVPFKPLSYYDTNSRDDYVGSMYTYTQSAVLQDNPEEFIYYIPKNNYKTTYYDEYFQNPYNDDLLIPIENLAPVSYYLVFMCGDNKITHVETDCHNGRNLVIFKDSYGNALVPCLTNSFENIYVCDIRYFYLNAVDFCKNVGCTDLLFAMNTYSATGGNESCIEQILVQ